MIRFADSTDLDKVSPFEFTHVAGYANGRYQASPRQLARFEKHFLIGVESGNPAQAKIARALDMERYDADAADLPGFVHERCDAGHDDALGYTSILGETPDEGIVAVVEAMRGINLPWYLWIAWWWGRPFAPTLAEVTAEILALTGLIVSPRSVAGCQWQNGPDFDSNVWYIKDTFTENIGAAADEPAPAAAAADELGVASLEQQRRFIA